MSTTPAYIVHLCPRQAWERAERNGEYRAPSLDSEGFIHFSRPDQLLRVANAYYLGMPDMVLLWVDPRRLQASVKWEAPAPEVEETFPHLYGPLNLDAVVAVHDFVADADGVYRQEPGIS